MESKYAALTVEDHIRSKDMWAGTKEKIATQMLIFARNTENSELTAEQKTIQLSPALFKCIDQSYAIKRFRLMAR